MRRACRVDRERDLDQDIGFGLRQLVDTAVRALSPGINDPTTATTCVGYLRSILVTLAGREFPPVVHRFPDRSLTVIARRREFDEYLDSLAEVGYHAARDLRVVQVLSDGLRSVASTAARAENGARAQAAAEVAISIAGEAWMITGEGPVEVHCLARQRTGAFLGLLRSVERRPEKLTAPQRAPRPPHV